MPFGGVGGGVALGGGGGGAVGRGVGVALGGGVGVGAGDAGGETRLPAAETTNQVPPNAVRPSPLVSLAFLSFTKKYSGWPLYVTCAPPVVPTSAALAPLATAGLPLARSGGQAAAHAPEHALLVPESFVNRYR